MWYHGDLVEVTGSQGECGGVVIHGRSDTTLKPGGVRIGTAEVYRFAETVAAVEDSLVIGDQIKVGKRAGDVRIVLFVKLVEVGAGGRRVVSPRREHWQSARHVPARVGGSTSPPTTPHHQGRDLDAELEAEIRTAIRSGASDAHVPALIKQVGKIPYTRSGKKVELAVRDLMAGTEPKNVGALLDPSAFDEYRELAEVGL